MDTKASTPSWISKGKIVEKRGKRERGGGGRGGRERQRQRDRDRDSQTDRQRQTETERQRGRRGGFCESVTVSRPTSPLLSF